MKCCICIWRATTRHHPPALAAGLPKIMGDATQLRQVIHNLLQNAQDAIGERTDQESAPRIDVITELVRMQEKIRKPS
jgi:nitrogen fixation/metabolism regulation signal transduction histidine kinase